MHAALKASGKLDDYLNNVVERAKDELVANVTKRGRITYSYRLFKPAFGTAGERLAARHRGLAVFCPGTTNKSNNATTPTNGTNMRRTAQPDQPGDLRARLGLMPFSFLTGFCFGLQVRLGFARLQNRCNHQLLKTSREFLGNRNRMVRIVVETQQLH
jgi:hypothetical protein